MGGQEESEVRVFISSLSCRADRLAGGGWAPLPRVAALGWLEDPLPRVATLSSCCLPFSPSMSWVVELCPLS